MSLLISPQMYTFRTCNSFLGMSPPHQKLLTLTLTLPIHHFTQSIKESGKFLIDQSLFWIFKYLAE